MTVAELKQVLHDYPHQDDEVVCDFSGMLEQTDRLRVSLVGNTRYVVLTHLNEQGGLSCV